MWTTTIKLEEEEESLSMQKQSKIFWVKNETFILLYYCHPTQLFIQQQVITGDNPEKENLVEFPKTKELLSTKATDVTAPQRITNMNNNKRVKVTILSEIRKDRKEFYNKLLEIEERKLTEKKEKNTFYRKKMN
ncbi:unnamed protein product [Acanthoscelides obtectus]|uniref:Uncharacterized protein n=1 Tax=Acanthoscelides obtectus TaxID=200917 RepID=A0A9P0KHD1_ACAOB|nr:unnamed protein product [Acanthoscelides obtectus]CAK1647615.1 hypothetical protein AOBTE_LOCUS15296 [Acanthoscelides obtectus]